MGKKKNTWLIIILAIIILGLVGYIIYDKVLSKEVTDKGKEPNTEAIKGEQQNELSLIGKYNRGTCAETGQVNCGILIITEQNNDSIHFKLNAYKGIAENGPNIGDLTGIAKLENNNIYKFYEKIYDTESTLLFKFNNNQVTIEESYSTGNNPYAGHGVYFAGIYEKDSSKASENETKYNSIIEEYKKAMEDENFENDTTYETKYPNINYTMMHYYHTYNSVTFNYLYYDINKDNKDELIIGNGNSIIAIHAYNGTSSISLFENRCLGDRCQVELWDNGIMFFEGSGGAAYHSYEFYKLGNDGYSKETIKKYYVEYKDNEVKTFTVTDRDTNEIVDFKSTDDIVASIKGNAKDVDLSKLNWIEIK